MDSDSAITFYGGAGTVTGSNFLLEHNGTRILIDCGLTQGEQYCHKCNYDDFEYDPASIDVLIATHAHADHIGRIPKLVRDGFNGVIYSTPATRDLSSIMFDDAVRILEDEARKENREPLYTLLDARKAMSLWKGVEYHAKGDASGIPFTFLDAGHILGSAMVEFLLNGKKVVFTGDLGNSPAPLLKDTERVDGATYILMESVYGDRNHEDRSARREKLKEAIVDTEGRGGTLLIPAFSIQRTQVLLYEINNMVEDGEVNEIPVFLDSPLAIKVTDIYRNYESLYNETVKKEIAAGDDIFDFAKLSFTPRVEESKAILTTPGPKIIIAGSGMSTGGRVLHHEKVYLQDSKSMLLLVGYQAVGTLGRHIADGLKHVTIFNDTINVRAEVRLIRGYSAHKDGEHLVEFVEPSAETLRKVFVAMGEPKASNFLAQRLHDFLGVDALVPKKGDRVVLEL
ncbi:MBL fold metallo-hydrolase [Candidatus Kaiserbacteria bacterium CG10_big_fil_rev_8_21_14_0_10_49_17]|uniref:MBL fold metallo-hydrolase n=1 Tax=Candidatus Kaiserbacteria bacterium CG10_big_fil_rev_8_21_14_0_10_49_17 TaxID=1974609 RepID=A0A2M6WEL3_9BACT|nr:MAG: MBL fold metallo-hydrolase [Candidatus Kaiserbacteria bacterium CG10_big_fil_rev_8_21_14_0_10_49_17]